MYKFATDIVPEDPSQDARPNVWIGGETRALDILKGRIIVEENVCRLLLNTINLYLLKPAHFR